MARHLAELGHEVAIITSSFDHFTKQEIRQGSTAEYEREVIDGVPFLWVKTPAYSGNSLSRLWGMFLFGAKVWFGDGIGMLEKPDVIIGSSPSPFAAFGAERRAKRLGVPFVLEIRDLWPQTPIELGNYSKYNPIILLMAWVERHLYRASKLIVSILPGAADHIASKGGDLNKIVWVPNGVDLGSVPKPQPRVRTETLRVVYAGSHGLANGLDTVIEAARLLQLEGATPKIEIMLYGDGPEKKHLMELAKQYQLTNVSFCAPVPKAEIWSKLLDADAFLMVLKDSPLFKWGVSPNKLFDYMATARPVIFSVSSTYNPIALAGSGITVRAGSANELAGAIKKLSLLPPKELIAMGLRGRAYIEEHHDLHTLVTKLANALARVVRSDGSMSAKVGMKT